LNSGFNALRALKDDLSRKIEDHISIKDKEPKYT
jgi:hypothetical protein